jgi:hypothetical protein
MFFSERSSICYALELPSTITDIQYNAFAGCNSQTELETACLNRLPVELINFPQNQMINT